MPATYAFAVVFYSLQNVTLVELLERARVVDWGMVVEPAPSRGRKIMVC